MILSMFPFQHCSGSGFTDNPPQPLPALIPFPVPCSSGESLRLTGGPGGPWGPGGPDIWKAMQEKSPPMCCPQGQSGAALRGDRTQGAAELLCQAGKPGLPLRTALGSSSNPGLSGWEAAAGLRGGLCKSCQYLGGGKAVRIFPKKG